METFILLPVWFDVGAAEHFNFIIPVLKVLHSTAAQQRKGFGFSCRFQSVLTWTAFTSALTISSMLSCFQFEAEATFCPTWFFSKILKEGVIYKYNLVAVFLSTFVPSSRGPSLWPKVHWSAHLCRTIRVGEIMSNFNFCRDWRSMFRLACFSDSLDRGSFANIVIVINNLFRMSFYPQMALDQLCFLGFSS